jgi:hypothetical protein
MVENAAPLVRQSVPLTQTSATLKRELGLRDLVFFAITCVQLLAVP